MPVIQQVLEEEHSVEDVIALHLMDGPVSFRADDDLAEEVNHPDRDVGDHEKLAFDIVIECVCLQDQDRLVLTKVELLAIRDRLATVLESRYCLWDPLELSGALVYLQRNPLPSGWTISVMRGTRSLK